MPFYFDKVASFLENSSKALTEIRNELVCQICKGHARPGKKHWYRCWDLHPICQDCKGKNEKCSCDGGHKITNEFCKMTEKLLSIDGMKYNCVNTKNGCKEVCDENTLEDHESGCIYRVIPSLCNSLDLECECDGKATFQEVIQHYEEKENVTLDSKDLKVKYTDDWENENCLSDEDCYLSPEKFTLNNQTFLLLGKTEDQIVYWWVSILGSPTEAKHFSYTLNLYGPKSTITFQGSVAAIDESFDTLYAAGKCFATPHKAFIAQVVDENSENGKYEYSLDIRNLKQEAMDEDNYESGVEDDEKSKE